MIGNKANCISARIPSLVAVIFIGCSLGPDYARPELDLPPIYKDSASEVRPAIDLAWWELFRDPQLVDLIHVGLEQNFDRQIAFQRIQESQAVLTVQRTSQFPQLFGSAGASRSQLSSEALAIRGIIGEEYSADASTTFELDLWGRLRRATEAERANLLASEFAYQAVTTRLIAQIASLYFRLQDLDARQKLATQTAKNRQEATELIRTRFTAGLVGEAEINQAVVEETDASAIAAALGRERSQAENALNVLLGQPSQPIVTVTSLSADNLNFDFDSGLPASLLERRPDIIAAEQTARARVARIAVIEASRLPAINLSGRIGVVARKPTDLTSGNATAWNVASDIFGPLFDWGRSQALIEAAEAQAQQAMIEYRRVVAVAVQEVEDALVAVRAFRDEYESRTRQADAAKQAANLVRIRFDQGISPYLEVLDVERSLFQARLQASSALQGYLASIVQLYRACGGGWDPYAAQGVGQSASEL